MEPVPASLLKSRERPADLPDFERPPLIEVVLGVQFSELRSYRTQHVGLLWNSKFRNKFPTCKEQPPLSAAFETFGSGVPKQSGLQLQVVSSPTPILPRMWFMKEDDSELVQIQADRFLHNWKRSKEDAKYPRYEAIRESFFNELAEVQTFFDEEGVGSIEPNQCEVTYVNHIELGEESDRRPQLGRIFDFCGALNSDEDAGAPKLPKFEDGAFVLRYTFRDQENEPRGRVHVEVQPAVMGEGKPIIRLALTARGGPSSPTWQGVADVLDLGRDALVRTFARITTKEMHQQWGRIK